MWRLIALLLRITRLTFEMARRFRRIACIRRACVLLPGEIELTIEVIGRIRRRMAIRHCGSVRGRTCGSGIGCDSGDNGHGELVPLKWHVDAHERVMRHKNRDG
ncbi:MAG: hypothetical protein ACYCZD_04825 [Rhodanobacter sp.]